MHHAHMTIKLSQDARLHSMYPICLEMQNMTFKKPDNIYYYTVCPHLFILYMIMHLNFRDNNDNVFANVTLITNKHKHAALQKVL